MAGATGTAGNSVIYRLYKAGGVWIGITGIGLAVISIYLSDPAHWTVLSAGWSLVGYVFLIGIVSMLFHALFTAHREVKASSRDRVELIAERDKALARPALRLPSIVKVLRVSDEVVLLLEPSILFGTGSAASIYTNHNGFEILLGEGRVIVVQQQGTIQVAINSLQEGTEDMWKSIMDSQPHALAATFARPGAQSS